MSRNFCRPTGYDRYRVTTANIRSSSTWTDTSLVSTMSRANLGPDCSAAIRTGADQSGFRLIFLPSSRYDICIPVLGKVSPLNCRQDLASKRASSRLPKNWSADCSESSSGIQTAADRHWDRMRASSAKEHGAIYCSSTSTFTAIPAKDLAPRIRPDGQRWPVHWWPIGGCEVVRSNKCLPTPRHCLLFSATFSSRRS